MNKRNHNANIKSNLFNKTCLVILLSFIYVYSYGQHITINRIESRLITDQGIEFIGDLNDKNNDLYTFPNWNNKGIIYLDSNAYSLANINFNVIKNSFDSRINRKKLFAFKSSRIDSVSINNLIFKKYGNYFYEVLCENGTNVFLKKHDITFQKGIENRIGGGALSKTKTLLAFNYLVKSGDIFKRVNLNKSSILGLLVSESDRLSLMDYAKRERLSYKRIKDVTKMFEFLMKNSNQII
jgi:hypothetical protein